MADVVMGLSACAVTSGKSSHDLDFSKQPYTEQSMVLNGGTIKFRAYEGIVYVKNPIDAEYEVMNIYAPEQYYQNGSIGGFTAETAPIFFANQVDGYMPAKPAKPELKSLRGAADNAEKSPNTAAVALSKGYVVDQQGRTDELCYRQDTSAIVDLKATMRYLKASSKVMSGNKNHFKWYPERVACCLPYWVQAAIIWIMKPFASLGCSEGG
ncbi:hypothetical protein [Neisseria yangbaofengii]|uniref:hypothetical protein n=1 Tax=Neisseria yangbaofengii TaxID=2709396 RepID=UPI0013EC2824|nr:hypothetical protein [Neisseria yangbaofengii]